jgi:hypothetical protein
MITAFIRAFNSWIQDRDNLIVKSYAKKDIAASKGNSKLEAKNVFHDKT